jgi:flagellar hook capping protein FlgD
VFTPGTEAHYYLRIRMSTNATIWTGPVYVTYDPAAVTAVAEPPLKGRLELAVGPNPTYGHVTASFSLAQPARNADLAIFDPSGRRVRTLLNGPLAAGPQSVTWTGHDDNGRVTPSGIFFIRLSADEISAAKKVLLIR